MLQEQLKYPAVWVEMALGHVTKDQNGAAYGRFEFIDDRKEMMQTWADYLDALRTGEDTSKFKIRGNIYSQKQIEQLISTIGKAKILELLK